MKRRAVAVVAAVVVAGKGGLLGESIGEQAAGQGQADDEGHALVGSLVEDVGDGTLAEDVEDDLQRGQARLL